MKANLSLRRMLATAPLLAFFVWGQGSCFADDQLEILFLNVGQADAIFVSCPDGEHTLLVDAADKRYPGSQQAFQTALEEQFADRPVKHLDVVVASHPDADHIGSMEWVLNEFKVDVYIDNGQKIDTATFGRLERRRRILERNHQVDYINGKENSFAQIEFCPSVEMQIIEPWAHELGLSGRNDRSVSVRLVYGETTFLLVGDLEAEAEEVMLHQFDEEQRGLLDVDVLKVGHHGSDTSSTAEFIRAVSPKLAIVSCGAKGVGTNVRYKHPRRSTMRAYNDELESIGSPARTDRFWAYEKQQERWRQTGRRQGLWVTSKDGTIIIRSDGATIDTVTENED